MRRIKWETGTFHERNQPQMEAFIGDVRVAYCWKQDNKRSAPYDIYIVRCDERYMWADEVPEKPTTLAEVKKIVQRLKVQGQLQLVIPDCWRRK